MDVLKFGLRYYKRHLWIALPCLFMGFGALAIALLFPQLTEIVLEYIIQPAAEGTEPIPVDGNIFAFIYDGGFGAPGTMEAMLNIAFLSVGLMMFKHILIYVRNNLYYLYGFKFDRDLRTATFKKLMTQSESVLSDYNTGDLLNIMHSDITNFRTLFVIIMPTILDMSFYLMLAIFFLVRINVYLAILPFAFLPIQIIIFIKYIKQARTINDEIRDSAAQLSMQVQENINGVRIIRSFASERFETYKFAQKSAEYRDKFFKQARFSTGYGIIFNSLRQLLYLSSIAVGAYFAIGGVIGIGAFAAFIAYVFVVLDAPMHIINLTFEMQHYIVCGDRIRKFVTQPDLIADPPMPVQIPQNPDIEFENVSLVIDGKSILKDVSFTLQYGKKLGIMGNTGSGKTTITKLMSRFLDATGGTVKLGGIDIKQYEVSEVRRVFGYTFQDVFLFSNTIDANIAYYNADAPHDTVVKYSRLACAHDFIQKMSDGYDTIVGERGTGLSGGQKQRISVARALLKEAPILLLDDVSSALDMETEKKLIANLFREYRGKSVVITAHRAASVMRCDHIIILGDDGTIIEEGTHHSLMRLNGAYAEIFQKQSGQQEDSN